MQQLNFMWSEYLTTISMTGSLSALFIVGAGAEVPTSNGNFELVEVGLLTHRVVKHFDAHFLQHIRAFLIYKGEYLNKWMSKWIEGNVTYCDPVFPSQKRSIPFRRSHCAYSAADRSAGQSRWSLPALIVSSAQCRCHSLCRADNGTHRTLGRSARSRRPSFDDIRRRGLPFTVAK